MLLLAPFALGLAVSAFKGLHPPKNGSLPACCDTCRGHPPRQGAVLIKPAGATPPGREPSSSNPQGGQPPTEGTSGDGPRKPPPQPVRHVGTTRQRHADGQAVRRFLEGKGKLPPQPPQPLWRATENRENTPPTAPVCGPPRHTATR